MKQAEGVKLNLGEGKMLIGSSNPLIYNLYMKAF